MRPWFTSAAHQAFVSALLELMERHYLKPANVTRMRIHLSPVSHAAYVDRRTIRGKWEASGSVYYTAAVVLFDRELKQELMGHSGHPDRLQAERRKVIDRKLDLCAASVNLQPEQRERVRDACRKVSQCADIGEPIKTLAGIRTSK